jgi:hypothetical protein
VARLDNTPDITIQEDEPPAYDASHRGKGIYLLPMWPFDPRQVAATVVTSREDGDVLGVDVLVNGEQPLALIAESQAADFANSDDITAVLMHELGHVLGLGESYDRPEATMFPQNGMSATHQRVLSADDEQGVIEIYSTPMESARVGCSVSEPGATTRSGTLVAVVVWLSGLSSARTRRRSRTALWRPRWPAAFAGGPGAVDRLVTNAVGSLFSTDPL